MSKHFSPLDGGQLALLTNTWAIWAENAGSPARAISRARLRLYFLLSRYGGMRPAEITSFAPHQSLSCQTGLLQLPDRGFFLPPEALRHIRRILTLPESRKPGFLQLDSGFVRRTFYQIANLAGLPPEACGPRALREARARELLDLHMDPRMIANYLGITSPARLARLTGPEAPTLPNHFTAVLASLETDFRQGRLHFELPHHVRLQGLCPLEKLASIEPTPGKPLNIHIEPTLVFPSPTPLPMANHLVCKVDYVACDTVVSRLNLVTLSGLPLLALPDSAKFSPEMLAPKAELDVYIPAGAVQICH